MMKRWSAACLTSLVLFGCSSDRPPSSADAGVGKAEKQEEGVPGVDTEKLPEPEAEAGTKNESANGIPKPNGDESMPPALTYSPGSAMRLLDGRALTKIYNRVFPKRSYGYEQCRNNRYLEIGDCHDSIWEPQERTFVGTIDLYTPDFGRGPQNIRQAEDLTLNYMRTIRVGLSRECENLVNREMTALREGRQDTNLLIKSLKPTPEALEEFFRKFIGVEGTGMKVDIGAAKYVASFGEFVGIRTDQETHRRAYFGLCIAIGMDPQIFIY